MRDVEIDPDVWVKLWRKSIKSRVFADPMLWKVWTWCLMRANYTTRHVPVRTGKGETIVTLEPGQFIFGRKTAAKALRMKPSSVRDRMRRLASMQNLDMQARHHYTIVTVCAWPTYQGHGEQPDSQSRQPAANQPPTNRQPTDTDKKVENVKKEKTYDDARDVSHAPEIELDLPPAVKDRIEALAFQLWGTGAFPLADWAAHYPPTWLVPALQETLDQGVTDHRYTKKILERWRKQGGMDEKRDEMPIRAI